MLSLFRKGDELQLFKKITRAPSIWGLLKRGTRVTFLWGWPEVLSILFSLGGLPVRTGVLTAASSPHRAALREANRFGFDLSA